MRARWHMGLFNFRDVLLVEGLLHQVIEKRPKDAKTCGGLSFLGVVEASWGWTKDTKTTAVTSIADAKRPESLDSLDPHVMVVISLALAMGREFQRADETSLRAVMEYSNLALTHGFRAVILGVAGKCVEVLVLLDSNRRLGPLDAELTLVVSVVSLVACSVGRFEDMLRQCDELIAINSEIPDAYSQRAVAVDRDGSCYDAEGRDGHVALPHRHAEAKLIQHTN